MTTTTATATVQSTSTTLEVTMQVLQPFTFAAWALGYATVKLVQALLSPSWVRLYKQVFNTIVFAGSLAYEWGTVARVQAEQLGYKLQVRLVDKTALEFLELSEVPCVAKRALCERSEHLEVIPQAEPQPQAEALEEYTLEEYWVPVVPASTAPEVARPEGQLLLTGSTDANVVSVIANEVSTLRGNEHEVAKPEVKPEVCNLGLTRKVLLAWAKEVKLPRYSRMTTAELREAYHSME